MRLLPSGHRNGGIVKKANGMSGTRFHKRDSSYNDTLS